MKLTSIASALALTLALASAQAPSPTSATGYRLTLKNQEPNARGGLSLSDANPKLVVETDVKGSSVQIRLVIITGSKPREVVLPNGQTYATNLRRDTYEVLPVAWLQDLDNKRAGVWEGTFNPAQIREKLKSLETPFLVTPNGDQYGPLNLEIQVLRYDTIVKRMRLKDSFITYGSAKSSD